MTQYVAAFAGRAHNLILTLTEGAKDVVAQKVTIAYTLEIVKAVNRTTWNVSGANQPWSITLGGATVASGSAFRFNFDTTTHSPTGANTHFTIASGSSQVSYNPDGTLNLSVAFSADADVWSGGVHGSGTKIMGVASYPSSGTTYFSPSSISVATVPTVTPKSTIIGATVTIGLPRTNPSFTHDVTWVSGTLSGTIGTGLGTSTTWTVADASSQFPSQTQSPIAITAVTKNGSTVIGSNSVTLLEWNSLPSISPNATVPFDIRIRLVEWNGSRLKATSPIVTTTLQLTDAASATPTLSVGTSGVVPGSNDDLDGKLVSMDVQNGATWQATGLLFVLSRSSLDDTDPTQASTYSGTGFVDFALARGYQTAVWKPSGAGVNAGYVMSTLIAQGHGKGWGPNIQSSFTGSVTTIGDPWQINNQTREISSGTPYSQILDALVNDGLCEWRSRYDDATGNCYLDIFNPVTGTDWTNSDSQVVVNLSTAQVAAAPTTWSFEGVLDRVYAIGDASTGSPSTSADNTPGIVASSERAPYNAASFGYMEGWASAAGQTTDAGIREVAGNALDNATLTLSREFSYSAFAVSRNLLPYYTFKPGDWILVPSDRNKTSDPIQMRVTQVVLNKTGDTLMVTVTCGDLIPSSASAATVKRIKASTGNRIAGGTLKDPVPLQSLLPAAPNFASETAAISDGYWDSNGAPRSYINFSWLPVTTALDGVTPLTVDYYEVWWRPNPSVDWVLKTFSTTTSVEMDNWPTGFTAQFQVRARSTGGTFGVFSAWDEVVTAQPGAELGGPSLIDLYTDGVGTIYLVWNGTLSGGGTGSGYGTGGYGLGGYGGGATIAAPAHLAYVAAEISTDGGATYTPIGTPIVAAGSIVINPNAYGDYFVRLRGYDRLGNPGTASTGQEIVTTDPHIAPPIPAAPTSLTGTAGAAWNTSGILPTAWFDLTWTAPTLDVDGNAVSIIGYDIFGLKTGETVERYITSSTSAAVRIAAGNGETWTFRVRASSAFGGVSAMSSTFTITADATISVASAPTAPTLDQYAGLLRIKWAGGGMVPQIKYVYATVSTTSGGTYVRAGMPLVGAGEIVVPGLATATDYYAKIVMVDELGQSSTSAYAGPLHLDPITGVTVQTSNLANTGIKLTNGSFTSYDATGNPTFILNAATGEVWIGAYNAVFDLGASGIVATTGAATTGLSISSDSSSFNTFVHSSGVEIRNDQTPLSWWEADADDASLVNFFSPRAVIDQRFRVGDYEMLKEAKTGGATRLVIRYKGL